MTTLREIVEGEDFLVQAEEVAQSVPRWDEARRGLDMVVARDPDTFPIAHGSLRVAKLTFPSIRPLRIFFTFDEDQVILLWVEEIPPDEIEELYLPI